jgi:sphingolipid delta-4 desaturase
MLFIDTNPLKIPKPLTSEDAIKNKELVDATLPCAVKTKEDDDFYWDGEKEPHFSRRQKILAAHPEIKTLMGPCPRTKWVVLATVVWQFAMCAVAPHVSFPVLFAMTYIISGTLNQMMALGIHEISHNLAFKEPVYNRWLSLFANLPMGVPAAITFRRYHLEHHKYQGEHAMDVDIPSKIEGSLFKTRPGKLLWMMLQPFFYAIRPLMVRPKQPGMWEYINFATAFSYDIILYYLFGWPAIFYTIGGSLMGAGLHPVAGHFISEHYVFSPGQETYSYYGPLNFVTFNVGYHNEHHDFANVPGSRLPALKAMAPEFYDNLPYYMSWSGVIYDYIMNAELNQYDRVKRKTLSDTEVETIQQREHQSAAFFKNK